MLPAKMYFDHCIIFALSTLFLCAIKRIKNKVRDTNKEAEPIALTTLNASLIVFVAALSAAKAYKGTKAKSKITAGREIFNLFIIRFIFLKHLTRLCCYIFPFKIKGRYLNKNLFARVDNNSLSLGSRCYNLNCAF